MKSQVLVKKYAQGLVNALADESEFSAVSRELGEISHLFSSHEELKGILFSPFLPRSKRYQALKEVLSRMRLEKKTMRFLMLVVEHDRLSLLEDILAALPILWNEKRGVTTFAVDSVIPLTRAQKERLRKELERVEKRPVDLSFNIQPDLIGGLRLRKGNIVYDASLHGHLERLKEKISEG